MEYSKHGGLSQKEHVISVDCGTVDTHTCRVSFSGYRNNFDLESFYMSEQT